MFTGIIESTGTVRQIKSRDNYKILKIMPEVKFEDVVLGESIAIDGCCLTIIAADDGEFVVEVSQETTRLSIIDEYKSGARVNLERALVFNGRLGGHFVTGHIDCRGRITESVTIGKSLVLSIKYPEEYGDYVVAKGSVAINGISLTINDVSRGIFTVNVIPFTREKTNIESFKAGRNVNLEFDILGKYIFKLLRKDIKSDLTLEKLVKSGW